MALNKHECINCGKTFSDYFKDTKFCSRNCYNNHRKERSALKVMECPVCGVPFRQKRTYSEFCSVECRVESTRNRVMCECDTCGVIFYRKISEVTKHTKHFCSPECRKTGLGWSEDDTQILIENYGFKPMNEILAMFSGKWNAEAIRRRAGYLGLCESRKWSELEEHLLVEYYSVVSIQELQEMIGTRTRSAILGKARQLGLFSHYYVSRNYTPDDDAFIIGNYLSMSNEEIAVELGRTESGISQRLYKLGLHRPTEICGYKHLRNYIRSRIVPWRDEYLLSKNYTCELTGSYRNVVLHHIRGFNLILQEALDLSGIEFYDDISKYSQDQLDTLFEEYVRLQDRYNQFICISEDVHKSFHGIYGYGNNTEEQWSDFVKQYYTC